MTHLGDTFEPDLRNHERYDYLYQHVYLEMYHRLQPLYQSIRKVSEKQGK